MDLKDVIRKNVLLLFMFLILCAAAGAGPSPADGDLDKAIAYLLNYVEQSRCTFIRNGKEHSASEAVAHMRRKYEYFKKKIETPEDFITHTATKSLVSGKPYLIKTKEGKILPSREWFLNALSRYRKETTGGDDRKD